MRGVDIRVSKMDSVDFMYDLGVGATALLGLGWMVSITL